MVHNARVSCIYVCECICKRYTSKLALLVSRTLLYILVVLSKNLPRKIDESDEQTHVFTRRRARMRVYVCVCVCVDAHSTVPMLFIQFSYYSSQLHLGPGSHATVISTVTASKPEQLWK